MTPRKFDKQFVRDYFAEVDRMDTEGLLEWYSDDASFRFANQDPAQGKAAIAELLRTFYGSIKDMRHEPLGIWVDAGSGAMEASVHFTTGDGRSLELPAVSVLRVQDGLVRDFRFVMDASPLQGGE